MEKVRLMGFYKAAIASYLGVTALYGGAVLYFLFLSADRPDWEIEGAALTVYSYAIAVSPILYLYEFSLYRLRAAGAAPVFSRTGSFAHVLWRAVMWALVLSASLLSLCWPLFGVI